MSRPKKLSPEEARRTLTLILDEGTYELSIHCLRDSMPKRNVTDPDIVNVLTSGQIIREAEWSDEHQNWKYRVEGADIEGDDLTAITVMFIEDLSVLVVTVF
ncbi:MAG TPA: DUF4258 domain-containing protein [Blastocatellia bacterium]|nr:DUF4258 domain-containing protein [Blastocatellia bacterium]